MKNVEMKNLEKIFWVNHDDYKLGDKQNLYEIISKPAYRDMTPRNLKGIGQRSKKEKDEVLFNWLADEFIKYFESDAKNENEFDEWHKKICDETCTKIGDLCDVDVHYGKAQKLVNMSFKHFYLFSDAKDKKEYFTYCHMPLDSYTLNWFSKVYKDIKVSCAWSNLEFEEYMKIQDKIRAYFKSSENKKYIDEDGNSLMPLIAEFFIWIEEQHLEDPKKFLINPCIQFLQSIENMKTFVGIENEDMLQKLKDVESETQSLIDILNRKYSTVR